MDDTIAAMARVERQVQSLMASATAPLPTLDLDRLRRSMEQAERGEGEDVAEDLNRVRAGGDL